MAPHGMTEEQTRHYHTKHTGPCKNCRCKLYPSHRWRKLSQPERKELLQNGWRRAGAHGFCQACYGKAWFNGSPEINSGIKRREDGRADVDYRRVYARKLTKKQVAELRAAIGWQPDWADDHWPELEEVADIVVEVEGGMLQSMYSILDSIIDGRKKESA
jgi:hypothetical protein